MENDVSIDILWPRDKQIEENKINNNAIVMKLRYNKFSMLFTGDIEEIAEKEIVSIYENTDILRSAILKIAHHGSKTSTTEEFLKLVDPRIALIGVGKNNLFGHPSDEIIKRLEEINVKVYRTDLNGEIEIIVNNKGNYLVNSIY